MSSKFGSVFMGFAGTAAFAFPAPYGVLASASLPGVNMLMQMFTGKDDKEENPIVKALKESQEQIRIMMEDERNKEHIENAALDTKENLDWITERWEVLKDLDDDKNSASEYVNDLLSKLNNADNPDNKVRRAIDDMDRLAQNSGIDLDIRDSAFEIMTMAVSVYLTYLRLRVQMKSWATLDSDDGHDLFYGWYDAFIKETGGQVEKVSQNLGNLQTETLVYLANQGIPDEEAGQQVDDKYSDITEGIKKWQANIDDWQENKPPRRPHKAPVISEESESNWAEKTPYGKEWVSGAKVRYAVASKNAKGGGSLHGPWTDWHTVGNRACPLLKDIPIDKLNIAKSRVIYRQFDGHDETKVGIIPDNSTTEYSDKKD